MRVGEMPAIELESETDFISILSRVLSLRGRGRISDSGAQCPSSFKWLLVSDGRVDDVPSFSTNRYIAPCLLANALIFKIKLSPGESFHHAHVAQPSSTACVFFAQHLPEIGPIGL
jgi:hypothetical protein